MHQHLATDCGVAALSSAMGCFGVRRSVGRMWQLYGRSNTAMSFLELQRVASANGFDARCFEYENLKTVSANYFPAVVHLPDDGGHFVTIDKRVGRWVRRSDPAGIQRWVNQDKIRGTGYLMTVRPSSEEVDRSSDRSGAALLAGLLLSARRRLAVIALLAIISTVAGLAVSQFVRVLIDFVTSGSVTTGSLVWLAVGTIALSAVGLAASYVAMRRAFTSSVAMERQLAIDYARTLVSLRGTAFRAYTPGDLMARFSDLSEMRAFVHDSLLSGILGTITFLGATTVLAMQSPLVATFCVAGVAVVAAARWLTGRRIEGLQRRAAAAESQLTQSMVEIVEGSATNRGTAWSGYQTPRLGEAFDGLITQTRRVFLSSSVLEVATGLAGSVILVSAMVAAALQVQSGSLSVGALASLAVLLPMMSTAAFSLVGLQQDIQLATVSAERIEEISFASAKTPEECPPGPTAHSGSELVTLSALEVRSSGVRLAYLPQMTIREGEIVGLRGPNGAGKSTVCRVLAGLEDEWTGRVSIDGVPLRNLDIANREEIVSYVPDTVAVTADSLLNNVTFGRQIADVEEICAAVGLERLAARLPIGYATPIGPPHVRLSGGESQRLGIARALTHHPRLLILDEATRMLDMATQRSIVQSILDNRLCGAILLVSHSESLDSAVTRIVEIGEAV